MTKLSIRWPEKVFLGYAALMLALLIGASFGRMIVCGIAFEILASPVGWLLGLGGWYSFLPDGLQYSVAYLAALANGAMFYSLLKIVFRKRGAVSKSRSSSHSSNALDLT